MPTVYKTSDGREFNTEADGRRWQDYLDKGVFRLANGETYVGDMTKHGSRHGYGKYMWPDGNVYEGYYKDNRRTEGKMTYANGNVYDGEWKTGGKEHNYVDLPHGKGKYTWANDTIQDGYWRYGKFVGDSPEDVYSDEEKFLDKYNNADNDVDKFFMAVDYAMKMPVNPPPKTPQQQSSSSGKGILVKIGIALAIIYVIYQVISFFGFDLFDRISAIASQTTSSAAGSLSSIVSSSAGWVTFVAGGNSDVTNNTHANIAFGRETIQNNEIDVMTLQVNLARGTEWRLGEFTLSNDTFLRQIKSANGIRFSVLGDGEGGWRVMFPMRETQSDNCFHEKSFTTTNGQVIQVDIPFSSLVQPSWGRRVTFNKRNILSIIIQRNATDSNYSGSPDSNYSGSSTIKAFGFEVY